MSTRRYDAAGMLVELWDDAARTYSDFRTTPTTTRPYTLEENARADAEAAAIAAATNEATITDQVRAAIDALLASRATIKTGITDVTNATINAGPAPYIKALAKAVRDDEQTLIRVCRLLARQLDSADAGAAASAP